MAHADERVAPEYEGTCLSSMERGLSVDPANFRTTAAPSWIARFRWTNGWPVAAPQLAVLDWTGYWVHSVPGFPQSEALLRTLSFIARLRSPAYNCCHLARLCDMNWNL